ncbi:HD-GYP domain-containing protein [Desulfotruncus alcoholivorax]|uniref:HD-GYP domain-containing protein n=1 Tax=Desulfotruncus alcoholivorax TaxID=265477 RepID=UPI00146FAC0D|nr:HD-GYP domain-containing protein [Desulfotruncus alcoholivorax]
MNMKVEGIRKGMYLATPFFLQNGTLAIPMGTKLEERHILFLKKMGIKEVEVSITPVTDELSVEFIQNEETLYRLIKEEFRVLVKDSLLNYSNILSRKHVAHQVADNLLHEIAAKKYLMDCLLDIKSIDSFTYRHSINVMVLSLLIGSALGILGRDLYNLGIGALFHDIGKMNVPKDVLFSEGKLSDQDKVKIEHHTVHGFEILIRLPDMTEEAAGIALMHHERINGSGYPHNIKEDQIHLYAQIVGIADVYEAMTTERKYRRAHNPLEIMEFLMGNSGILFDEHVVKSLLESVSIFRIGSVVQLNNNECGVVVQANPSLPARPVLRLIFDRHHLKVRKQILIDLAAQENTTLSITRVFG